MKLLRCPGIKLLQISGLTYTCNSILHLTFISDVEKHKASASLVVYIQKDRPFHKTLPIGRRQTKRQTYLYVKIKSRYHSERITIKRVYNDHLRDPKNVDAVDTGLLFFFF